MEVVGFEPTAAGSTAASDYKSATISHSVTPPKDRLGPRFVLLSTDSEPGASCFTPPLPAITHSTGAKTLLMALTSDTNLRFFDYGVKAVVALSRQRK